MGVPHGSVSQTELTTTKQPAGELYGPGEVVGKSFDFTAASVQAKHFQADFLSHWGIDSVVNGNTNNDWVVQDESPDILEANSDRWQTFLGTTRKP